MKRDFFVIGEAKERLGEIDRALYAWTGTIFNRYRRVRDGMMSRGEFQEELSSVRERVESLLAEGATYTGLLAGKCRAFLCPRDPLWTFVSPSDVEPTHNLAERMIRPAVLWRKMGGLRASGVRGMLERALTVSAT